MKKMITRRNFLKAAGVSAAALGLAACGGSGSSTAASSTAGSAAASAAASDWTWERKVTLVCPWGVGGGADGTLRPLQLVNQPQFLSATFASMFVSNIVMVFAAMIIARIFVQVLKIPYSILGPTIIMMATIGAYSTKNTAVDVILMAISGLIGFVFSTCKFNSSAMILGLVLGVICESNLRRAYTIVAGDTLMEATINILTRPVTGIIILICILVLLSPVYKPLLKKHNKEAAAK